jgi:hypothetical protein
MQSDDVEIRVDVGESQATVKGTATDGNDVTAPSATVVLAPNDRSRADLFAVMTTDQNGEFEMRCVQPGAYRLYAWTELDGAAYRNADFMKNYDARGVAVDVSQGAHITVPIRVIPLEGN